LQVTPELTTLAETTETGSTNSSLTAIKVAPLPAAACNGPKKLGGWGRFKAKTSAEDPPDPPPPPSSCSPATYSSSSVASGTLAPAGEILRPNSPVRMVPQICLRTDEDDSVESVLDLNAVAEASAVVVPVSEEEEVVEVVPESVAVGVATTTAAANAVEPGSTARSGQSLVDPSEMLASLQQFKVWT